MLTGVRNVCCTEVVHVHACWNAYRRGRSRRLLDAKRCAEGLRVPARGVSPNTAVSSAGSLFKLLRCERDATYDWPVWLLQAIGARDSVDAKYMNFEYVQNTDPELFVSIIRSFGEFK